MEFIKLTTRNQGQLKREARETTGKICNIIQDENGKPLMFENRTEAQDYLETLPVVTNRVSAVRYMEHEGTEKQNTRIAKQELKIQEREDKADKFVSDWLERTKNSKLKFKGCKSCSKRFDRSELVDMYCPECGESFLSNGDQKRYDRLLELVKKEENRLADLIAKRGGKLNKFYLVGNPIEEKTGITLDENGDSEDVLVA